MRNVYVAASSIVDAINTFSQTTYTSPEQIGLFFVFKGIGFNSKEYVKYSKDNESRKNTTRILYYLSALFDKDAEAGEKRTSLFPFSFAKTIKKSDFYNGGTPFVKLYGRIKDTIDNTLVDDGKYMKKDELNDGQYKFTPDYINVLKESFLNGEKISLRNLAAWYFRFNAFPVENEWIDDKNKQHFDNFTRMCCKKLIRELNLTSEEVEDLFDTESGEIRYSINPVSGEELRSYFNFESGAEPEVQEIKPSDEVLNFDLTLSDNEVNELLKPHGNNITPEKLEELLRNTKQVILAGPPGTGKSYASNFIRKHFTDSFLIQFHPNITYEEFIGGATFNENGIVEARAGIFLEFCEKARSCPKDDFLFIIDEINRGNISKIFGETILTLDREYAASLPVKLKLKNGSFVTSFTIPENVYILATMNSADRSIALVDYAIRRRFAFVNYYPNSEIIDFISDYTNLPGIQVSTVMNKLNEKLLEALGDANLLLGQAYFMPKWAIDKQTHKIYWNPEILMNQFNYYIIPIIEEYTYGNRRMLVNILGNELPNRLFDVEEFMENIILQFGK
jgi:5-methylcytosine-specific restriction enzyme B